MRQGTTFALVPLLCLGIMQGISPAGSWTLPDESRGSRVAPLFLLSRPEVRDDLRLPPELATEVDQAIESLYQKAAALKGKTGEAAIAARKLVDQGQESWLKAHLAPDQVDRLAQIDLRWEGASAMIRPTIAEALALSDEQKAGLHRAILDRNALRDKTKDAASAEHQFALRAASMLSDGQKQRWTRMLGRPLGSSETVVSSSVPEPR